MGDKEVPMSLRKFTANITLTQFQYHQKQLTKNSHNMKATWYLKTQVAEFANLM